MDFSTKIDELSQIVEPLNVKRKKLQNIIQVFTLEYSKVSDDLLRNVMNMKFLNDVQTFYTQEVSKIDDFDNKFQKYLTELIDKCLELNLIIPHVWDYLINNVIRYFGEYKYKYDTEQYKYTYLDLIIENDELLELLNDFKSYIVDSHYLKVLKDKYDYSQYLKEEVKDKYQELFYDLLHYSYDEDLNLEQVIRQLNHYIYWFTKSYVVPFSLDNRENYTFEKPLEVNSLTSNLAKIVRQGLTRKRFRSIKPFTFDVKPLQKMIKQLNKHKVKRRRTSS